MSIQKQSSETALGTLFLRALSCYEPDERIRGQDHLAKLFLPAERKIKLDYEAYRSVALRRVKAGVYYYVIARTAYFDQIFLDGLKNAVPQILILGAGYDSRAYRYENLFGDTKIFEIDASYTQKDKIALLRQNHIDFHHVRFVPIDFEKDDLAKTLLQNGFEEQKRSLFLWEGVTLYLTREAMRRTLGSIASVAKDQSVLAFDYLNFDPGENQIIKKDEVIQVGMNEDEMAALAGEYGFSAEENLNPHEIEKKYLTGLNGEIIGETNQAMNFIKLQYHFLSSQFSVY